MRRAIDAASARGSARSRGAALAWALLAGLAALATAPRASADDVALDLDLRAVVSDGRRSFMDGGLGKLRYGDDDARAALGRLRLAWHGALTDTLQGVVDASAWGRDENNPIDLTEAYVEWRPVPSSAWRSRVKLGAFYPSISLEHRAAGWTNPYTISSSALNTWVGEELRTIGAEYRLERAGRAAGGDWDAGLHAAVYGWNDPAGVVVAVRGFALHDRQTTLFGRVPTYVPAGPQKRVIFEEIDGRPGGYVGGYARWLDQLELRATHYDNRADPGAWSAKIQDYAWHTVFDALGARWDSPGGTTVIAQWLGGDTAAGPGAANYWDFDAAFALVAHQWGPHRLAVRLDRFRMEQVRTSFGARSRDDGHAYTVAWTWEPTARLSFTGEWLGIDSTVAWRAWLGERPHAFEQSLQFGVHYAWSASRPR